MDAPDRTDLSCFTSPLALPQILVRIVNGKAFQIASSAVGVSNSSASSTTGPMVILICRMDTAYRFLHTPGAALQKAAGSRQVWSKSIRRQGRKGGMVAVARHGGDPCKHAAARPA